MLNQYFKECKKCIDNKNDDPDWCTCAEYMDIHLSNGSVFEDIFQCSCDPRYANEIEDIEMEFDYNIYDKERRRIHIRIGDIIAIVERHIGD